MASLLQQLENNEAILLMFLANELPPEDHVEVEQHLRTDANLGAQLESLRAADDALLADVQADLAAGPLRIREAAVVRDAGRMIRQWQVDRAAAAAQAGSAPTEAAPRSRWWVYPIAAAAIVAVVFIAFWGGPGEVPGTQADPGIEQAIATHLQNIEEETLTARAEPLERLDDAETQMAALDALASSSSVLFEGANEQN